MYIIACCTGCGIQTVADKVDHESIQLSTFVRALNITIINAVHKNVRVRLGRLEVLSHPAVVLHKINESDDHIFYGRMQIESQIV